MADSEERFGVRLAAPPGLGADGVQDIAQVLSPVTGRPADELAAQLKRGPIVVHAHIIEADARQLVQTFRALGARADLVEAVELSAPVSDSSSATRPLFAQSDLGQVDKAWRHVTTGARPAVRVSQEPPASSSPSKGPEAAGRQGPVVASPNLSQTQPLSSGVVAGMMAPPPEPSSPTARLTVTPGLIASAIFRPQNRRDTVVPPPKAPTARAPMDTQPIDPDILAASSPTKPAASPVSDLATVRFPAMQKGGPPPGVTQAVSVPGPADTVEISAPQMNEDESQTRPFQRFQDTVSVHPSATQPMSQPPGPVRAKASTDGKTVRDSTADVPTGANTGRFGADTAMLEAATVDLTETGSIGSVQFGAKIFRLALPAVGPTETGSMPTPARLDPMSAVDRRENIEGPEFALLPPPAPPSPASGGPPPIAAPTEPPPFPTEEPGRPGIYRLPGLRPRGSAEPSVVAADPDRPVSDPPRPSLRPPLPAIASVPPAPFDDLPPPLPPARPTMPSPSAVNPTVALRSAELAAQHSPGTAAWMSLLVPGLGQVYNGQRERGILFALGTPLVIPYLMGIVDAFRTAEAISRGRYSAPDPNARQSAFVGQLALGLVMIFGTIVLAMIWRRPAPSGIPIARRAAIVAPPTARASAPPSLVVSAPATAPRKPLGDTLEVPALMRKGRMACDQGLYNECEEIMHEVIEREPGNRDAYNLLVEAPQQRKGRPAPASE